MNQVLITGGSGYLGRYLVSLAQGLYEIHYTYFSHDPLQLENSYQLDVRNAKAVSTLIHTLQPEIIIHTAVSNRGSDMANSIVAGAQHLTTAAKQVKARLIHLSTDSIFRGDEAPYDEAALPTPVNEYGRAKAEAETIVQQWPNHVIVRTSLIYGLTEMDHGTAWMAQALRAGQPVMLFDNQVRNPVWVETVSRACVELVNHPYRGILNVAGEQILSRAAFGLKMLDWWQIQPRTTLSIGPSTGGNWPLDCRLNLTRATAVLQTPMPGVDEVLQKAQSTSNF